MKNNDLVRKIEKQLIDSVDFEYRNCIQKYLFDLKKQKSDALVQISNGECEYEGIYAPAKDNDVDLTRARPFSEGQSLPDGDDWIRVG